MYGLMLERLYRTLLVIGFSIRPASPEKSGARSITTAESSPSFSIHVVASKEAIRFHLSDICGGIDRHSEIRLLFPGCYAMAAPFLLYRLKRSGFSGSRALMTGEGLLLTALR
jgi:hypothetical protein